MIKYSFIYQLNGIKWQKKKMVLNGKKRNDIKWNKMYSTKWKKNAINCK